MNVLNRKYGVKAKKPSKTTIKGLLLQSIIITTSVMLGLNLVESVTSMCTAVERGLKQHSKDCRGKPVVYYSRSKQTFAV